MPDTSLTLEMLIKNGRAIAGLEQQEKATEKLVKTTGKIAGEAKKADAELDRFVKRMQGLNNTPLDKVRGQLAQLETAFAKGKISLLDYAQAHTRLAAEEKTLSVAMSDRKAKLQDMSQAYAVAQQRDKQYYAALAAAATKGTAIYMDKAAARKNADKAANAEMRKAPALVGGIEEIALRWGSVAVAIGVATKALGSHHAKLETVQQRMRDLLPSEIEMGQVGINAEQVDRLTAHGLTRPEARDFALQSQNLGIEQEDVEWMAKRKAGLGDMRQIVEGAGVLPKLFGGAINTRESINMIGVAAEKSRLTPGEMSKIVGRAAAGGKPTTDSAEEIIAFASNFAQKFATAEQAATNIGFMGTHLRMHPQFKDLSMIESVKKMQVMQKEKPESLSGQGSILGHDKERWEFFFKANESLAEVEAGKAELHTERLNTNTPEEWASRVTQRNLANPAISTQLDLIAKEEDLKKSQDKRHGVKRAPVQAKRADYLKNLEDSGATPFENWASDTAMQAAEFFGFPELAIPAANAFGGGVNRTFLKTTQKKQSPPKYTGEPLTGRFATPPPPESSPRSDAQDSINVIQALDRELGKEKGKDSGAKEAAADMKEAAAMMMQAAQTLIAAAGPGGGIPTGMIQYDAQRPLV